MPLTSDLTLNASLFRPSAVPAAQAAFNEHLSHLSATNPAWWVVGAATYRRMREEGKTVFPPRTVLDSGRNIDIPSRDSGRSVPCRYFTPTSGAKPAAVFMHVHGGGWVLGSQLDYDPYCQRLADDSGVLVITVGYRLAPENIWPAAPHDCYDVADWLVANAEKEFGAPLAVLGGESAGGHLSMLTALYLMARSGEKGGAYGGIKALIMLYGGFDLSGTPATQNHTANLVVSKEFVDSAVEAFLPQAKEDPLFLKRPDVSPFYADLSKFEKLPPAIFSCGVPDPLVEDTLFMSARWLAAGGEAVVKFHPGLAHGFATFNPEKAKGPKENFADIAEFLKGRFD